MKPMVKSGQANIDTLPIQNGLKQGDALSLVLFSFDLECISRKVQENQDGLRFSGTNQFLVYADYEKFIG
jgi:hypothetical protein